MKTLYLMQDGTHADPADVSADPKGVLRNKSGLAVALYEDGKPQTVGEDAVRNKNVEAAKAGTPAVAAAPAAADAVEAKPVKPLEAKPAIPSAEAKVG
jgi:hypothetical protein